MKKSKILVPALGILVLSTAASITGTVAWFSVNNSVTVDGMSVTTKVAGNLLITDDNSSDANYGSVLHQGRTGVGERLGQLRDVGKEGFDRREVDRRAHVPGTVHDKLCGAAGRGLVVFLHPFLPCPVEPVGTHLPFLDRALQDGGIVGRFRRSFRLVGIPMRDHRVENVPETARSESVEIGQQHAVEREQVVSRRKLLEPAGRAEFLKRFRPILDVLFGVCGDVGDFGVVAVFALARKVEKKHRSSFRYLYPDRFEFQPSAVLRLFI